MTVQQPERELSPAGRAGWRRRLVAVLLLAATIVAGLLVHAAASHVFWPVAHNASSDIMGDALYAVAAYLAVIVLVPRLHPGAVACIAGAWCAAVELFQLTGLPAVWGASFAPITLVLGTVFDARDLLVYLAAVVVAALIDLTIRRIHR